MITLACPHCENATTVIKFGTNRGGSARYRCRACGKTFTPDRTRSEGRATDDPSHSQKRAEPIERCLARLPAPADDVIEMDELCLRQSPALWLWIAISRQTRQVLGFVLGDRTDAMAEQVWSEMPADYREKLVCTDDWGAYARLLPVSQHQACEKGSGLTSIVEGLNTKWRQRQSGLVRRSCGVHPRIADDLFERFLLLVDSHNLLCEQRWKRQLSKTTTMQSNP